MRVLVVAAGEPWPLNSGGRLHLYHVVHQLARRADVTLALPCPVEYPEQLPANLRVVSLSAPAPGAGTNGNGRLQPLIARLAGRHFGHNDLVEAWIRREARPENYDVALLNGAVLGQHVEAFGVPVVWNPQDELVLPTIRDAQYGGWRTWLAAARRVALYAGFERYVAARAAATIFVSAVDAACARRWGAPRVEVVQNGVDFGYFRPDGRPSERGTVVFVGSLEFSPNVDGITDFVARVWPRIHAGDPGRRLLVVGRRPVARVRTLAATPGVELAADVPDVRPYLTRASAVVVPIRTGGGLKNKVLEACAMRRPVVASPRALAGLSARPGVDLLCATGIRRWVECVERLLDRPAYADGLAHRGFEWVHGTHCWRVTGERFHEILSAAAQQSRRVCRSGAASIAAGRLPGSTEPCGASSRRAGRLAAKTHDSSASRGGACETGVRRGPAST